MEKPKPEISMQCRCSKNPMPITCVDRNNNKKIQVQIDGLIILARTRVCVCAVLGTEICWQKLELHVKQKYLFKNYEM